MQITSLRRLIVLADAACTLMALGLALQSIALVWLALITSVDVSYGRLVLPFVLAGTGMAAGGWLAGVMYDHFGYYEPAFVAGVAANLLNALIIGVLVARRQWTMGPPPRRRAENLAPEVRVTPA